jgi:hypothetical protein
MNLLRIAILLCSVPLLVGQAIAAEDSILLDVKSEEFASEGAKVALARVASKDRRFKVVEMGEDWQVWLTDYRRSDNGTSYSVTLKASLVHPAAPNRNSPVATQDVGYSFAKEPRDVLTTDDGLVRFVRAKIKDKSADFSAEETAAEPAMSAALNGLVGPMISSEGRRMLNMRARSANLLKSP